MEIKIQFSTDNAAFEDSGIAYETARILRVLAKKLDESWDGKHEDEYKLRDVNGNTVGKCIIENYCEVAKNL